MPEVVPDLTDYLDPELVQKYEADRFRGRLGSYTWKREQRAVGQMISAAGTAQFVLDCPCGIGRWLPQLDGLRPDLIVEADVSPAMLAASRARHGGRWPCCYGNAEALPFPDGSFDLVFSHALMRHLPADTQATVLSEFARVSNQYVVCSFSVLQGLPGFVRRLRRLPDQSPVTPSWITQAAAHAGLRLQVRAHCTTPIGIEQSMLFVKDTPGVS